MIATRLSPTLRRLLPALLALPLAACGPMVQIGSGKGEHPQVLYTLSAATPDRQAAGGETADAAIDPASAISVAVPTTPAALQTLRIPVTLSDTEIQYVQSASWSEQPNILFQRLLADTLMAQGISIIDLRSTGRTASRRLTGQLQHFGVDLRDGRRVHIRYDATLSGPAHVHQRRFQQMVDIHGMTSAEIVTALNTAANAMAGEVADWIGSAS